MGPWILALSWLLVSPVQAAVHRFAMVVGNNEGEIAAHALVFAEQDAEKVGAVLEELGGYPEDNVRTLLDDNRNGLLREFGELRRDIAAARDEGDPGDEILFLFFYSGHADEEGLQLGRTRLEYDELERMLDESGADVRLAFVDACQSGQMTRRKGAKPAPSFIFDVSERLGAEGTVIITSSTGDEASQESDEIGGSYFTHYLVGGLSGAADRDGNARITLSEAYDYVYRETVLKTANTRLGAQHPTFEWDLAGEGDVVLTDLEPARSSLRFPADLPGTYAVFDLERRVFVGEVSVSEGARQLAVRPGRYLVQIRYPTHLQVAEATVYDGQVLDVAELTFEAVEYEDDVAKGAIERQARKERRPDSSVRLLVGAAAPTQPDVLAEYLPAMTIGGVSYRVDWRRGQWFAVDLLGGTGQGELAIPGVATMDARGSLTTLGATAGYATRERWRAGVQAGAGLRVAATWIGRSVYETQGPQQQQLTALSPGVSWFVGAHPGRFLFDLEWHRMVIPFPLDDERVTWGTREVTLAAGMRW